MIENGYTVTLNAEQVEKLEELMRMDNHDTMEEALSECIRTWHQATVDHVFLKENAARMRTGK